MIYLDHNATTPIDPEVSDAVFSALRRDYGNPSSTHAVGMRAKEMLESSRSAVADFLGCAAEEVVFTSGGTEANNLAIVGRAMAAGTGHILTSRIEHPSVLNPCRRLIAAGFPVTEVGVDSTGIVKLDDLAKAIRKETILISIMHANNETGVIQPIDEIGRIARERKVVFHVDAAQSIGKMPFRIGPEGPDLVTVVPHKFYGPKGVGALIVRSGVALSPIMHGAGHERGLRPGTENLPAIAGFAKTCQIGQRDMKMRVQHTTTLRTLLFDLMQAAIPDLKLNGHATTRLPNTLNVMIPSVSALRLFGTISDRVAVSAGSACHAGSAAPSAVLKEMGLSDADALSSLRISIGKDNTEDEIREAAAILAAAADELRKTAPAQT